MSSPPFLMEDQTDADFFDKLVDDEFSASDSNPSFSHDVLGSGDVNAFSNLSVADEFGEAEFAEDAQVEGKSKQLSVNPLDADAIEKEILVSEESVSLVSTSFDNKVESCDANDSTESTTTRRGLGSKSVSIKEVQWTLFSAQNGATREAPYTEFFADFGGSGVDPFNSLGDNSNADPFNSLGDNSNMDPFTSVGDNSNADPFTSVGDNSDADPFTNLGDNSNADPFGNSEGNVNLSLDPTPNTTKNVASDSATPVSSQNHIGKVCVASTEQVTNDQELHDSQYWENLYPGWRYDQKTGEWIQVEGYDAATANAQVTSGNSAQALGDAFVSGQKSEVSYLQQTSQSVAGTLAEGCTTGSVSTWKNLQQATTEYPLHMVLDPQYPGWYYDTIAQEWRTLESYDQALQSNTGYSEQFQSLNNANGGLSSHEHNLFGTGDAKIYSPKYVTGLNGGGNLSDSVHSYGQQNGTWHPETVANSDYASRSTNMQQAETVMKSGYAQQNRNMWQPETVAKSDHAQQHTNMWQPETVAKSDHAQQNRNMWQSDTISNNDYIQQSRNMWQPETVANSDCAQQNKNMWQSETVVKSDFTQPNRNIWQPEQAVKSDYPQQNRNMWQPDTIAKSDSMSGFTENQKLDKFYGSVDHVDNIRDQYIGSTGNSFTHEQTSRNHIGNDVVTRFQTFVPSENNSQHFSQPMLEQSQPKLPSYDLYPSQTSGFHSSQPFPTNTQPFYGVSEGRSSAGRPPHALVSFGFGGKLVVMKDCSSYASNLSYGNQESVNSISVLNIMDVVAEKNETHIGLSSDDYFRTLCQQSYPGPLVGGNAGAKDVTKWIDERITKCEATYTDYSKGELLRLLLSMLKIASQSYGRLRSPFGTDPSSKGSDRPEKAVAELFASSRNDAQLSGYGTIARCLQNMPSEAQLLATAAEVESLLVSGSRMEALHCAQEGQLWGYALQLAADLGEQYYVDTTRQMAHQMLVAGSPLKTLSLLMAGQPADIFVVDNVSNISEASAANMFQHQAQIGPNAVLDDWRRNLAIITANRTKGDELVLLHLGDCLWKERGENIAAHMCYLLSETNFESFSDSARLCLIGADHWKFPRTYASPEAIQRTEFYEYSKVLGNSQSVLLPFQPYKIIYAYMLAEVGRLSDSLKYCQAILKSLKANRAAEVDAWKQVLSSLEDRIRAHQQTGFGTNLVPKKLVGKFLPFIDSTIHRMMGPPPPTGDHGNHSVVPKVANSQSTMAMQSLVPSASMEPISAWASGGNRNSMPNRSVSEPDFGRSPRQVGPNETSSSDNQGKASDSGAPSRFGLFGSNLLQKTVGWVSRSKADRQAKLGEKNKFYYDEKLKRWVEEGAPPPAEAVAPPPPPTTAAFQNGMSDYHGRHSLNTESSPFNGGTEVRSPPYSERTSGIPPVPPTSNQFSARGRMGVRSRYVDTFNKGNGSQASFSSPSVPIAKPGVGANANFFIPTPTSSGEQTADLASETTQEAAIRQDLPTDTSKELFRSPPTPSSMQRFPSMNNLTPTGNRGMGLAGSGSGSGSFSRRTASWSGSASNAFSPPRVNEIKPLGEQLGMSPSSYMPSPSSMHMPMNGGNIGDDLHEVEL